MTTRHETEREGSVENILGLLTDPDMPTQVGHRSAQRVLDWLESETDSKWAIEIIADPVTAGRSDSEELRQHVAAYRDQHAWRLAVCLTDLPLLAPKSPVLAEVHTDQNVAVVSIPALGAFTADRRTVHTLTRVLGDILRLETPSPGKAFRRRTAEQESPLRYTSPPVRGWITLIAGMVRANRPWQLVWGLSSALAAAMAAAGFGIFTSTVWQIGDVLGPFRALATMVFAVALMTGWLITAHGLWGRVGRRGVRDRRLALLYNASTVTTLTLGVALLYAMVYAVSLAAAGAVLDIDVLARNLGHPVSWDTYFRLAWMVTSMAIIAGALGSSLESDAAVRQAAYGYREEQRQTKQEHEEQAEERGTKAD